MVNGSVGKLALKVIQIGTGGHGAYWCREYLPPLIAKGLVEVVAAVDTNPAALIHAKEGLDLSDDQCYIDIEAAMAKHRVDFCTIVVPPAYHEHIVDLAIKHEMHILSEKPIADTLEGSIRIVDKVKSSGLKMGVTMTHRFDQDKTSLRHVIRNGYYGKLDYLSCKYSGDYRKFGSARDYRHEMLDPLMIEMAVHHLDILADLAGDVCETIYAETWNPAWGQFSGDSQGIVVMKMKNGVRAVYEGANTNAVGLNNWGNEYIRAECEKATLVLNHRRIEHFPYNDHGVNATNREGQGEEIALEQQEHWGNEWLIKQFVDWLGGGPPMETNVEDNLQSIALVFAAIESVRNGCPINVQAFLQESIDQVIQECERVRRL